MRLIRRRSAVLLSAAALAGGVLLIEPARLAGLDLSLGDGRLTIGAVRAPLLSAAFAQAADTVVLEDVTVDFGWVAYKAKSIAFEGTTTSRADIAALFDKASGATLADRFARIAARRVVIPELVSERSLNGLKQVSTQRNIVLTAIGQGRIAQVTSDGGTARSEMPQGTMTVEQGAMVIGDIDVAGLARVYGASAGPAPEALRKLVGSFALNGLTVSGPKGFAMKVDRATAQDLYARPIPGGTAALMQRLMDLSRNAKPSEQELTGLMATYGDLLGAADYGLVELAGITITPPQGDGTDGGGRIARIAYTGSVNGQVPDARMEGLEVVTPKGTARIGTIAFTGFSFQGTADGLKAFRGKPFSDLTPETLRKLVPTIGTIRLSGFDVDLPNDKPAGGAAERVRFTLKDLEVTADRPQNGIPTNVRLALSNFAMPIAPGTKQEGLRDLAALGYAGIDLSFMTAASWQEPGELVIREISTRMAEGGSITLKGLLGNVTRDVFDPDSAVAVVALIGATARNLELKVENDGLFDRVLAQQARQQGKTAEAMRREFATVAAVGIPALLGNSPQAKTIAQAIGRFVARPGRLTIAATTRDAAGLGFADVMALSEPADILDRLDVTAVAE